jgi:peptidoglycan/LPS O-acetylase OafA/YrhL
MRQNFIRADRPGNGPSTQQFRPDIEGLRGVAILLVVFYHIGVPGFAGGYVGVDVFFVLSGYLITGLLLQEIETTGHLRLRNFYARRARRLLPAAALTLALTCLASYWLLSPVEQMELPKSAITTAAYTSNIYFARKSTAYLPRVTDTNPFLHTWSLSVEEQFYLAWPVLLLLCRGGRRRLWWAMVATFLGTLALSFWLTFFRQPWAFFLSPPRGWEFAAGGLGVLLSKQTKFAPLLRWVGLVLVIGASAMFSGMTPFPGIAAAVPVIGTVMILHGRDASQGLGRFLSARPLRWLGRLSYSWYLWHWPVLVIATSIWGTISAAARGECLLLSLALAFVTYHTVENPIRRSQWLGWRPARSLAMAGCLAICGVGVALLWAMALRQVLASPPQQRLAHAATNRPEVYDLGCFAGFYPTAPVKCVFGSGRTVVLFGDSHAAQWFPALRELTGWRVVTFLKGACAAPDVSYFYPTLRRRYTECEQWRSAAFDVMRELHPEAVVISSSSSYVPGMVNAKEWQAGTQRTIEKLSRLGARVYIIRDTPRPYFAVPSCLSRALWVKWLPSRGCGFRFDERALNDLYTGEKAAAANSGARYLDLNELVCPQSNCLPEANGEVIYDNDSYLTPSFVKRLANVFQDALDEK